MKKITTFALLLLMFTSCDNSSKLASQYEIVSDKFEPVFKKALIDVQLKRKVTEAELKEIAAEIKSKNSRAERFMIKYFLADTPDNSAAWAVTNYNPEEYIKILGTTDSQDKTMTDTTHNKILPSTVKGEILGTWKVNATYMERTISLYKEDKLIKMLSVYPDGSNGVDTLTQKKNKNEIRFYKKFDEPNEYYVIEPNRNLSVYSNNKKFTEAARQ